jgi:hypothetical protein
VELEFYHPFLLERGRSRGIITGTSFKKGALRRTWNKILDNNSHMRLEVTTQRSHIAV